MKLMEKYSKHLESIVAERTHELVEEKKKTDRLLYGTNSFFSLFKHKERFFIVCLVSRWSTDA